MKTVDEFLADGLDFIKGDKCYKHRESGDEFHRHWHEAPRMYSDKIVSEFAWRENTGVKPEFKGLIEVELKDGTVMHQKKSSEFMWELKLSGFSETRSIVKWRPILNQSQHSEWPDNSHIDSIGQNGNDGLHYDNAAQQVESLAVNAQRPIFTRVMADANELPPIGSFVDVVGKNGVELFYGEGEVNCEVLAHVENTAVIKMGYGLGCFSSDALKASDTRTDIEKAIDDALFDIGAKIGDVSSIGAVVSCMINAGYRKC